MRDNIVDEYVTHTVTGIIMNSVQFYYNFSYFSYILFPKFIYDALFFGQYSYDHYTPMNI